MKKLFTMMLLASAGLYAHAQEKPVQAIKINPISLLVKTGNVSYERAVAHNKSVQLGGFFSGMSFGDLKYQGFGITPEFRYYFGGAKEVLHGGYVAPFVRYQQFTISEKSSTDRVRLQTMGGGAIMGWAHHGKSGFVFDIFFGPSYNYTRFKAGDPNDFDIKGGIDGFGLRTGLAVGFTL